MKTMNEILMEAIVSLAAFFELSTEDVIRTEIAVNQLESLADIVDQLSDEDKRVFAEYIYSRITVEQQGEDRPEYLDFLQSFLEILEESEE